MAMGVIAHMGMCRLGAILRLGDRRWEVWDLVRYRVGGSGSALWKGCIGCGESPEGGGERVLEVGDGRWRRV